MLDIKRIKENPDAVKAGLRAKEMDCDAVIDRILELDIQVRGLKTATETKTAEKNKLSKEMASCLVRKRVLKSVVRTYPLLKRKLTPIWPPLLPSTKPLPMIR